MLFYFRNDASVTICNKDNETPTDKTTGEVHEKLLRLAQEMNQDLQSKTHYKVSHCFSFFFNQYQ